MLKFYSGRIHFQTTKQLLTNNAVIANVKKVKVFNPYDKPTKSYKYCGGEWI